MSQNGKKIVGGVLIVIFSLYYASICLFYHGHIINGVTIVHSHIHGQDHAQTGTHTSSELTLFLVLSIFHSLVTTLCFSSFGIIFFAKIIRLFAEEKVASDFLACVSLRAPPISRFFMKL